MTTLSSDYPIPVFSSYARGTVDPVVASYMEILEEYIRALHLDIKQLSLELEAAKQRIATLETP